MRSRPRRILVKFGGNALSGDGALNDIALQLAELIEAGFQPVLVHGGGPEISAEMERRGMAVRKAAGQRITDAAALAVVIEVLTGINTQVVEALRAGGVNAIGLTAADAGVLCIRKPPVTIIERGVGKKVDLGMVGIVTDVRGDKLEGMLSRGEVPVICPIGADIDGRRYNVNADTMASFVARAVGAEEMVLLTDVPGILRGGEGTYEVISTIAAPQIENLIEEGVITGGMIPKVEACRDALQYGVTKVLVLNGKEERSMVRRLLGAEKIGTTITQG